MALSGCALAKTWYDWDTTACAGPADWDSLWDYYIDGITYTAYWASGHGNDLQFNTAVAIRVIYDKINEIEAGPGVSMASILNAMLLATKDELTQFIGIVDAYRSAVWDQPFNAEFYAALAQGFRI